MGQEYHDVPQPYRIQKRLVLNQSFRSIHAETGHPGRLTYVTFGGDNVYDVMDLVSVFDIMRSPINIYSYERDPDRARSAQSCPVARALSKVDTITINIVPVEFPDELDGLRLLRPASRFFYFLDYQGTFSDREANALMELLTEGLLLQGDYLLITSCLSPRIVHQTGFMDAHRASFAFFYGLTQVTREFKERNHVDLLVARAFSRFARATKGLGRQVRLQPFLLRKFKYRDSKVPMGLWLYRIDKHELTTHRLKDEVFEEFPHSFKKPSEEGLEIPNIFD